MYFIDDLLLVACRFCHGLCIPYLNLKRPKWLLCIDVLSCIPASDIIESIAGENYGKPFEFIDYLKFARISYYFYYHSRMVSCETLKISVFFMLFSGLLLTLFTICSLAFTNCVLLSSCNITTLTFDVCHSVTILTFRGLSGPQDRFWIFILAGALALFIWFTFTLNRISFLITSFISSKEYESSTQQKLRSTIKQMKRLEVSKNLQQTAAEFIQLDWKRRGSYNDMAVINCLKYLTNCLEAELYAEVFCAALKHSELFQNMDLPFIRCVARTMRSKRIFPGEILFQKGSYKHQMIYIAAGVVEILSEKYGDTPVLSLSPGTCLGESTLLFGYSSTVSIRCKDYGKIHVLRMEDLIKISAKFPRQYRKLKAIIKARYNKARELCKITEILDEKYLMVPKTPELTLMWLTTTLHSLMESHGDSTKIHKRQNMYLRETADEEQFNRRHFFANHLNVLAITERASMHADTVFVKYKFPPILQPDSVIRLAWDLIICITGLFMCVLIPFYFALPVLIPHWYWKLVGLVTFLYILDVYIHLTSAVNQNGRVLSNIPDILLYKVTSIPFCIDVLAAFPLEDLRDLIFNNTGDEFDVILHLNRSCKLLSVILIIGKFEKYFPTHTILIRRIKNALPFFYISFFVSCAFFRSEADILSLSLKNLPEYISYGYQICATDGFTQTAQLVESTYLNYYTIVYVTLILYTITISKYTAEKIQATTKVYDFRKICLCMKSATDAFQISVDCKNRMQRYIHTQWQYDKGLQLVHSTTMLEKLPVFLLQTVMADVASVAVKNVPLFKELPEEVLFKLCSTAKVQMFPPKEIICYSGSLQNCFHYILYGYVDIFDSSFNKIVGVIGPSSTISVVEACLHLHVLYTYITSTHCKIITFSLPLVLSILSSQLDEVNITEKNPAFEEIRDELARIYNRKPIVDCNLNLREDVKSFRSFGYKLGIDTDEEYEYYVPFDRCGIFSFIRIVLLRNTILPYGKFLFCWEVSRSMFALISATLFVINPLVTCWGCPWIYFLYFLDIVAWIDIYVRLHICYYNESGILISHPLKTALHYITHAFIIDVIAAFPFAFIFYPDTPSTYKLYTFLHCTRIIQVYRYFKLIRIIHTPCNRYYRTIAILKHLPFFFIFCNCLSSILSNIDCTFHESINKSPFENGVECDADSFYLLSEYRMPLSKFDVHFFSFLFMIRWMTTSGIPTSNPASLTDNVITTGAIICGYIFHILILVRFTAAFTKVRPKLWQHQKSLNSLKRFMKTGMVDKVFQREILEHYELNWKVTRGANLTQEATIPLSNSLREDVLYDVFGKTLQTCSVFKHKTTAYFLKMLLLETEHETIAPTTTICFVNQVIARMYILFKGSVEVIAPDGTKLAVLQKGSLFGNLDDYHRVRQTISIKAVSECEVLSVNASRFHAVLAGFPKLQKQFKYLTILHIDYLPGKADTDETEEKKVYKRRRHNLHFLRFWYFFVFLTVFFSTALQFYMQSLREYNYLLLVFLYLSDFVYALYFSGKFPCSKIKNKTFRSSILLKLTLFILDSFPLDLAAFFLESNRNSRYKLILLLRLNRILRIRYFFIYFDQFRGRLHVSTKLMKILKLITLLSTILHIMSCVHVTVNCTDPPNYAGKMNCEVLKYTTNNHKDKLLLYLLHVHFSVMCFLLGTQFEHYPVSLNSAFYLCPVLLFSSFLFALSSAYVISLMRIEALAFIEYQANYLSMKHFMECHNLSAAIIGKVCYYVQCMWKAQKEPIFPEMLEKAPIALKINVMNCVYAGVITNHPIFKKCHSDFLKQLILTVKLNRYFAGDYIAFKGDINGCMYFIHKGKVEMLQEDTQSKADVVLQAGQGFGVTQGLYSNKPHDYFFKALNNTVIVVLEKTNWEYLLAYFPASREVIYKVAADYFAF